MAEPGIVDDFTNECNALAEYASALNVAGDCCANAVVRLQGAKSEDERNRIRDELRRFLRITILAAAVPFAALNEEFPVTKGTP